MHKQGSFVYRLAGRDRQRSASYYTPEVLTRTVVKHALAELITDETAAADLLDYRSANPRWVQARSPTRPSTSSPTEYLQRRQKETDQTIDPAHYHEELQKVKAWIALHQVYGVDLNATAVELAEVSMWLNVMHPGLHAPWFGLHLRRGNSLIGARRAMFRLSQVEKKTWLKDIPEDFPLTDVDTDLLAGDPTATLGGRIHHFLIPAEGWGSAVDVKEAKELDPRRSNG